jgi:hypothetical protein
MEGPARDVLGRLEAERGRLTEGVRNSALGLEFARSVGEDQQLLPALTSHACVLLLAGRRRDAAALLDEFLELADQPTVAVANAAAALVELGRDADFERLDPAALASPWGAAAAAFARRDFARAAELYAAAGAHLHEAEARLRLAGALEAAGAHAEAKREAEAAATFFRRAGAARRVETPAAASARASA